MLFLLFILFILMMASVPHYGYSRNWGYGPSGGLGTILIILLVLVLLGHIHVY